MLRGSVLGALYRCWLGSRVFAWMQWVWLHVSRAARGCQIRHFIFGPSPLERFYAGSCFARLLRLPADGLIALFRLLVRWSRGSAVCTRLAPVVRASRLLRYEIVFGLFCCLMFIVPHSAWNNFWAVIAAAVFLLLHLLRRGAGLARPSPTGLLGFGFALFVLSFPLSMLFTVSRLDSTRILVLFLAGFAFCWLIASGFDDPASLRRLMGFLYISLLAVSVYGIFQRLLGDVEVDTAFTDMRINQGVPGRIYATLDNPNNLSGFIQLFLPLSAAYASGTKGFWRRDLLALGLVFPAAALIMTYSRAGWISVMLAAAVYVYFREKRLLPALVVLVLLAVPLLPDSVMTRLDTITNSQDSSRNHRLATWEGVVKLLRHKGYWLTGIGLGPEAFQTVYPDYAAPGAESGAYQSQMLYLELDLELGILGFVSFLWMCLKYAGRIGRAIAAGGGGPENRLILAAGLSTFAALTVSSCVEYLWFYQRLIFAYFIWFGVIVAALRVAERSAGISEEDMPHA